MAEWLGEQGITDIAMESTGVYWKPVWRILAGSGYNFKLLLANARTSKPQTRNLSPSHAPFSLHKTRLTCFINTAVFLPMQKREPSSIYCQTVMHLQSRNICGTCRRGTG